MSYLTVLTSEGRCNKLVSLSTSGGVVKKAGNTSGDFIAETWYVGDVRDMRDLLMEVSESPNKCLAQGYFPGTEPSDDYVVGEPFRVLPKAAVERATGAAYDGTGAVINGQLTFARTKQSMLPSAWIQLDRDAAAGIPDTLRTMSDADWIAAVASFCPGLDKAGYVRIGSTSGRVLLDGEPLDKFGCRYWLQIADPGDYTKFGQRLKIAALAGGFGFEKRIKKGVVPWTIFDPTVFSHERLVFDGQPSLGRKRSRDRMSLADVDIRVHAGGVLDTSKLVVDAQAAEMVEKNYRISLTGDTTTATGYLQLTTRLPTREYGLMSVEDYFFSDMGKVVCQAVFRGSVSWNAFLSRDSEQMPRMFDNGDRQWYALSESDREVLKLRQAQALASMSLDPVSRALLGEGTQSGVARYAASILKGVVLFAEGVGWLVWDGKRWATDRLSRVMYEVHKVVLMSNETKMHSAGFIEGAMRLLKSEPGMHIDGGVLDAEPMLLNTPSGLLDLRTDVIRPCRPDDLITHITAADLDDDADIEGTRFESFLVEITDGDAELEEFLQRSLGACLSGAVEEHWLLFWTGSGRNGKNTLGDLVARVMGDYAGVLPSSVLMSQRFDGHPTDLMEMQGRRLMVSSEIAEGSFWDESRLNSVTGDANIKARRMGQDFVEFPRTHKHLIYGNARPMLRSVTPALKARLKIVPFNVSFIGREDGSLGETLWGERDAVLNWLADGHAMWLKNGYHIGSCGAVDLEVESYTSGQDIIETWIENCCETGPGMDANATQLYRSFTSWCDDHGETHVSQRRFGEKMHHRFPKVKSVGCMKYVGVSVINANSAQVVGFNSKVKS